jgi:hypothetical protein
MEKLKFSDLVHYDRNDPTKLTHVYFDVTDEFAEKLIICLEKFMDESAGKYPTQKEFMVALSDAIDAEFPQMNVPQILATLHAFTNFDSKTRGFQQGYEQAQADFVTAMNTPTKREQKGGKGSSGIITTLN